MENDLVLFNGYKIVSDIVKYFRISQILKFDRKIIKFREN